MGSYGEDGDPMTVFTETYVFRPRFSSEAAYLSHPAVVVVIVLVADSTYPPRLQNLSFIAHLSSLALNT